LPDPILDATHICMGPGHAQCPPMGVPTARAHPQP
jgi:hypothetical protein